MIKKILVPIFFAFILLSVKATHNRGGEITYRQLSAYTYEFTITTLTYTLSNQERPELEIMWGDNTSSAAPRTSIVKLPDYYQKNIYRQTHTFPGPGIYEIVMQDPNRNLGVQNIPNSVNVLFAIKTTMIVSPQLGTNNTPVLLNDPRDKASLGQTFIHNPSAFDIDGDSISYKLATCLSDGGKPIDNYTFPRSSDTLYVNPVTGDLVWKNPMDTGIFNIAMNIEEWRKGVKICNIVRDMQVEVKNSLNKPPVNEPLRNWCIEAGTILQFSVKSTDTIFDRISQYASGGPLSSLLDGIATFVPDPLNTGMGYSASIFRWQTNCSHVRKQPYYVVIKSEDNASLRLTDLDNFSINVLAPAPKNLRTLAKDNSIIVNWSKAVCVNATGYDIYQASGATNFVIDSCLGGIPASSGFVKVGWVKAGDNDTTFIDTGLSKGVNYCYRVVATFADGAVGYPSEQSCTTLSPGNPALTATSVTVIDATNGEIFVSWIKPQGLDTILGPFEYKIYRADSYLSSNFKLISTKQTPDGLDTTYTDKGLNTESFPYTYKVELYKDSLGRKVLAGAPETASSMYPRLSAADNQVTVKLVKAAPWVNYRYIIYRKSLQTNAFDSIGYTDTGEFIDNGLANGHIYWYLAKAYGSRTIDAKKYFTLNWSHSDSISPLDTLKPCQPTLNAVTNCDSSLNIISWLNPNTYCANDIIKYNIFFKRGLSYPFSLIATITNPDITVFRHHPDETLAGCYAVTAIDSFNNESTILQEQCTEICTGYSLPNVFTPNNDEFNDIYKAYNPDGYVKKVEMKIFNRWGKLVFETSDPNINWDGRDKNSKHYVTTGVYYYLCDVYEPRLAGIEVRNMNGFIHVYTETSNNNLDR